MLFAACDAAFIILAFHAAYWCRLRLQVKHEFFLIDAVSVSLIGWSILIWVGLGLWWEIYDRVDSAHPRVIVGDVLRQCSLGAVSVILFEYSWRLDLSRPFVAFFVGWTCLLLCLFRLNSGRLLRMVRRGFGGPDYVIVVGLGDAAIRMGQQLERAVSYGVRLIGFVADSTDGAAPAEIELGETYPVHPISELPDLLRSQVIDEVIFAVDSRRLADLEEMLLLCDEEGVRTRVGVDFFPHVNSSMCLDRLGEIPLLTFSAAPHDEIRLLVKRAADILLAVAALILLSPIMAFIGLLIRLTSPGPAIFRQERCGLNGRRFMLYKFRSMCENAAAMRGSVEHMSERVVALKIANDPRLTLLGRWLRKFSIDEWPQLWNVVRGDMSLVGPRPAVPEEIQQYKRWQRRRLRMRPGLTCLWAVKGRDALDFDTWMKLDMQYIDNWSLALDWKIILQTIPELLSGKGAH